MTDFALKKTDPAKYQSVKAFADECRSIASQRGFASCEVADFLDTLPDNTWEDAAAAVDAVQQHPKFGASSCRDGILYCRWNATREEAPRVQVLSMRGLLKHPWPVVHQMLDSCLGDPNMKFRSVEALQLMLDHVRAYHPRAEEWLMRDWNRRHIPKDVKITKGGDCGHAETWPEFSEAAQ